MAETSLQSLLVRLWRLLSRRRQIQLGVLLGIMVLSALCEMVSLGAVLPFIGILTTPEKVFNNPVVHQLAIRSGFTEPAQLVFPITVAFSFAALMAGIIRLIMLWASTRLANSIGTDFSLDIFKKTLYQPYKVHVARNSSEVISGITGKSWNVVAVIQSLLTIASSLILTLSLSFTLFVVDPIVISVAALVLGVSYGAITLTCRKRLNVNSQIIARENSQIIRVLQEGLGGIRDVLLNGSQRIYLETYQMADAPLRKAYGNTVFIATGPRFAMEAIGMIMIAVLAYGISFQSGSLTSALPVLAALALGAQRLLPVVQLVYSGWVNLAGSRASVIDALELLDQPLPSDALNPEPDPAKFTDSIVFSDVRFRYYDDAPWVLDGFNLSISKGSRIGLVGQTGSGKSTILDLMMGLLDPTEGSIMVDGIKINDESRRAWQRCIGHVPQSIFLSDNTIAENIAFGVPKKEIDLQKVRIAAERAQIATFVENMKDGYNTLVGERGIRLSGGQRQRIGIARALYRNVSVLIFDEATSSLDNETEQAVMEAINRLDRELTILLIAHRLTTVQKCDCIIELQQGKIVSSGTYQELLAMSPSFRRMALAVA